MVCFGDVLWIYRQKYKHRQLIFKPNKKVAIIIGQLTTGGAELQAVNLAIGLAKSRLFNPVIISLSSNISKYYKHLLEYNNINYILCKRRIPYFDILRLMEMIDICKNEKIEILFSFMNVANFYTMLLNIFLNKKKWISTNRLYEEHLPVFKKKIFIYIMSKSDLIITNSNAQTLWIKKSINKSFRGDIYTVYNGLQKPEQSIVYKTITPLHFLTIALFKKEKNLNLFIDIIDKLHKVIPLNATIVGDGVNKVHLINRIREKGLFSIIKMVGHLDQPWSKFHTNIIYLNTSITEGLSNSIIEAQMKGVPVIATDVGGTHEIITHGNTGYIVEKFDSKKFIDYCLLLNDNRKLLREMSQNAKKKSRECFSSDQMIIKTELIMKKLIN